MSVGLWVLPTSESVPIFGELAEALADLVTRTSTSADVGRLWRDPGITPRNIQVTEIIEKTGERLTAPTRSLGFVAGYGWISIDDPGVAFDMYFHDSDPGSWELAEADRVRYSPDAAETPTRNPAVPWSWYLRLSAGQPPACRLLAGLTAVALAQLTTGVVASFDGGLATEWNPALPETVLDRYPAWLAEQCRANGWWEELLLDPVLDVRDVPLQFELWFEDRYGPIDWGRVDWAGIVQELTNTPEGNVARVVAFDEIGRRVLNDPR